MKQDLKFKDIFNKVSRNDIRGAFDVLDEICDKTEDTEILIQKDLLHNQFNRIQAEKVQGVNNKNEPFNAFVKSLLSFTYEVKKFITENESYHIKSNYSKESPIVEVTDQNEKESRQTVDEAINIYRNKLLNISYKSTKKDIQEILYLKEEITQSLFDELNQRFLNIPKIKDHKPILLFESIFSSDVLSDNQISEIYQIRINTDQFDSNDRITIINGLTCSILNFKKLDQKKLNILFDFISDKEPKVEDFALVGTIISLIFHNNKWQRFSEIKKRTEFLKDNLNIQDKLELIEFIFNFKLFELVNYEPDIFEDEFFKESFSHYFIPFALDNKFVKIILSESDFYEESLKFADALDKTPIIDPFKFVALNNFSRTGPTIKSQHIEKEKRKNKWLQLSSYLQQFTPFINIIANFYHFYEHYPTKAKIKLFNEQLSIGKSKLRDYVLSEKKKYLIKANKLMQEKKFSPAIKIWKELLIIDPINKEALWKITNCFYNTKDFNNSIKYGHLFLEYINSNDEDMIYNLSLSYLSNEEPKKSLKWIKKNLKQEPINPKYFLLAGNCYNDLKQYTKAIEYFLKHINNDGKHKDEAYNRIGDGYFFQEEYEIAIKNYLKALFLKTDNPIYFYDAGKCYSEMQMYEKAIPYLEKAKDLDKQNQQYKFLYGRSLFCAGSSSRQVKQLFLELTKDPKYRTKVQYDEISSKS